MRNIISMEARLRTDGLTEANLLQAKKWGFTDRTIGRLTGKEELAIREERKTLGILPTHKMVDTCAAEFEAATPYYYSAYAQEDEVVPSDRRKVMVLGSGPIRIGQGVEFDYCSVHSSWALREMGLESLKNAALDHRRKRRRKNPERSQVGARTKP